MEQITVTIGRNAGSSHTEIGDTQTPLDQASWDSFRFIVRSHLLADGFEVTVDNDGLGYWDGKTEDNHVFIGVRDWSLDRNPDDHTDVRGKLDRQLASVGARYGQDAVAIGWGFSRLVDCVATNQEGSAA